MSKQTGDVSEENTVVSSRLDVAYNRLLMKGVRQSKTTLRGLFNSLLTYAKE